MNSQGLDGEYWEVGNGPRSRKPLVTLELETALEPVKEKKPRKKRAPLSEEQKRAIAARMKQKMAIRKAQAEILQERDARGLLLLVDRIEVFNPMFQRRRSE
mgnify:CR=1 FL=1